MTTKATPEDKMSAENKHTREPWEASEPCDYSDYGGKCVVILGDDLRVATVLGDSPESVASAKRICACINALAGIANPSAVPELVATLKEWMKERERKGYMIRDEWEPKVQDALANLERSQP